MSETIVQNTMNGNTRQNRQQSGTKGSSSAQLPIIDGSDRRHHVQFKVTNSTDTTGLGVGHFPCISSLCSPKATASMHTITLVVVITDTGRSHWLVCHLLCANAFSVSSAFGPGTVPASIRP
ncbi:hypothetical protein BaRGS_00036112 [Batillaria attramentaria]|uniref:Uncharacterized protein n=1 Tax=Batillaria attramentaria TaxID=370345 RepID=A0ABD0JCX8_9CAEN